MRPLTFEVSRGDRVNLRGSNGCGKSSLCGRAHLSLWDEPLNYIDIFSRVQLEELLKQFQPTMVFVEHDRMFAERIATRTVEITP